MRTILGVVLIFVPLVLFITAPIDFWPDGLENPVGWIVLWFVVSAIWLGIEKIFTP